MTSLGRLTRRQDFLHLQKSGDKDIRRTLVVLMRKGETDTKTPRIGFTVTKRIGNAVMRNRVKRRLRASVRSQAHIFASSADYVIIGRAHTLKAGFSAIEKDLCNAISRLNSRAMPKTKKKYPRQKLLSGSG